MSRRTRVLIGAVVVILAVWLIGPFVPIYRETHRFCPFCRAQVIERKVLFISLRPQVREGRMARYWRDHVERRHFHAWVHSHTMVRYVLGVLWSCGPPPPTMGLSEDGEIALLSSLPSAQQRAFFAYEVWRIAQWDRERASHLVRQLGDAYSAKPDRKDWPELLKKYGLLPTGSATEPSADRTDSGGSR